jgi:hypothetical protein
VDQKDIINKLEQRKAELVEAMTIAQQQAALPYKAAIGEIENIIKILNGGDA